MKKNQELEIVNQRIEELFQQWKNLQPMKKEDQDRFDKKVRLDWNFHSNKIEGNTLTYNETETLLIENKEKGIHPPRDYKEIKAHDLAINKIKDFAKDKGRKLNEATIRELNRIILKEPFWKEAVTADGQKTQKKIIPGQYKTQPNHVRTEEGNIFKFAETHDVPIKMQELMDWFNKETETPTLSIASFIAQLHHKFILIHPFDDGNGRVTRLWINYVLLCFDYPPLVIKSENKRNYFAALQRADHGDMDALSIYLGKVLIFWLEIGIKAGKGEDISEASDVDKEIDLFVRERVAETSSKNLSIKSAINLIDSLDILFKTFKDKFKVFNKLFDHNEENQNIIVYLSEESEMFYGSEILQLFENIEDIKKKLGLLEGQYMPPLLSELVKDEDLIHQIISEDTDQTSPGLLQRVASKVLGLDVYRREDVLCHVGICIDLLYRTYHDKLKTLPVDMKAHLCVHMNKIKYKISIINKIRDNEGEKREETKEERYYNQLFTQEEADKFIAKGKEQFLKLLKSTVGKDTDDKK